MSGIPELMEHAHAVGLHRAHQLLIGGNRGIVIASE
jgi:hypothetical protein